MRSYKPLQTSSSIFSIEEKLQILLLQTMVAKIDEHTPPKMGYGLDPIIEGKGALASPSVLNIQLGYEIFT
jgi:hypothetical protein